MGDIAHLNLDESQMPYRYDIGEVMLRKTHGLRTVITKVGFIKNVYRTFDYELLAGVDNLETIQSEDKLQFKVNVGTVYWCSRLATERNRVIKEYFKPNDVLLDMFCGIGPMAIKASKELGIKVLANDLNPDCYHYL